jgi:hypothetical protein
MPDAPPPKITLTEHPDYLEAKLQATSSADLILLQFQQILDHCAVRKPARMFVDLTAITGKYSTLDRYDLGLLGSRLAPHVGRVAALGMPDFLDPEKFAAQVAQNRGLKVDVFTDREAALAWLLA